MTRFRRKIVACCTVGLLLFTQLTVAGYACPRTDPGRDVMPQLTDAGAVKPCHEQDQENLNLCKQHCDQSTQSVDNRTQTKIDLPMLPVLAWFLSSDTRQPKTWIALTHSPPTFTKPPLYIHNCSFLI